MISAQGPLTWSLGPTMDALQALEAVKDMPSFLAFARALAADRGDAEYFLSRNLSLPEGEVAWSSNTISAFLKSAIAWADGTGFGGAEGIPDNPWRRFAAFLYGGKVYE